MSVESLISNAQGYATGVTNAARTALKDASTLVGMVGYIQPGVIEVALPDAPHPTSEMTLPTYQPVDLDLPGEPDDAPNYQPIGAISTLGMPQFTDAAPTLTLPTKPSELAAFLEAAPGINTNFDFPDPPDALINPLIAVPVINDRAEPVKPQVMLPVFDAVAPTDTPLAPTDLDTRFKSAYQDISPEMRTVLDGQVDAMLLKHNPRYHEQMARIENQLATYLDGGTGLNPAVENAIYERSRGKANAEARRVRDSAFSDAAARGFTLPGGAVFSAVQNARQAAADINATASREIVVKQAEMEQQNLQFAVTTSTNLRMTLLQASLSYHQNLISINGQALDYAKTVLSSIIEIYNLEVKAFSLRLDAYKAEAVVYETRLKSAMATIELYKVEVQVLEAMTNVDKAKVDVYRARIEALVSLSNVYRAQIDAVVAKANLEKLKIDVFQSKVQAFTAQVQAKNSEWQGYSAAVNGETAKVQLHQVQASIYNSRLQGYKTGIDAQSEVVRAAAVTNEAKARQYAAVLDGYKSVVQARGQVASTRLESQRQQVMVFDSHNRARVADAQIQQEYYKSVSIIGIKNADLLQAAQFQTGTNATNFAKTIAELGISTGNVYSGLASAAMSGMTSLAAQIGQDD